MAKTFNTAAINTAIAAAFAAAETYGQHVAKLQALFVGADRETIASFVMPIAAKRYGAELIEKSTGRIVWADKDCAAKRYSNRLISAIIGKATAPREETKAIRLSATQKQLAEKLLAECHGDVKRAIAALKAMTE